jgi:phosphate transporter
LRKFLLFILNIITNKVLSYSQLKKIIYQLEKDLFTVKKTQNNSGTESQPLIDNTAKANNTFMPALDKELRKILDFYSKKEAELYTELEKLNTKVTQLDFAFVQIDSTKLTNSSNQNDQDLGEITEEPEESPKEIQTEETKKFRSNSLTSSHRPRKESLSIYRPTSLHDPAIFPKWGAQTTLMLTKDSIDSFVQLSELKNYVNLNYTGFCKILKKYDKVTGVSMSQLYLTQTVKASYPYLEPTTERLQEKIDQAQFIYAKLREIDEQTAFEELRSHLKEHVVWERNTVWRDMIGMERRANGLAVQQNYVPPTAGYGAVDKVPIISTKSIYANFKTILLSALCIGVFIGILIWRPFGDRHVDHCFALLIFASLLWATEVIPLFVTAIMIPGLLVCLGIMRDPITNDPLTAPQATQAVFASMFSPVIMLLLGGFSLAAALSKHHIAKSLASMVLSKAGTTPSNVVLANMIVATFASMWISNVAAPVLCFSLIQPILRTLPSKSPYANCLIIGIALASNIGGMASPISSPQNIIAIGNMSPKPSWLEWFAITIPVCVVGILIVWALLLFIYRPNQHSNTINHVRYNSESFNTTQYFVCFITILTIILWCLESQIENLVGDMGVIAILPLVAFFGFGILSKDDFNNFLWTVIILAMGGIALGKGVKSSGLLLILSNYVKQLVSHLSLYGILCVFCVFVLVATTFISHTVGALIVLPIVAEVGSSLPDPHPKLLVMAGALMCSCAMGLPVSGFPNMNAIMMEDEMGVRYLSVMDFIKAGVPSSFLLYFVVISLGYVIMMLLGY